MDDVDEKEAFEGQCIFEAGNEPHQKYGVFPLECRFGAESTGLNFTSRDQSLNDVGAGECLLAGSAKDPTKRFASLHCTFRVVGENDISPLIIFANDNPNKENPWDMPPGLCKKKQNGKAMKVLRRIFITQRLKLCFNLTLGSTKKLL